MANGDDPGDETRREITILKAAYDGAIVSAIKPGSLLCAVCGVAWGFPCGRVHCGLNEGNGENRQG